MKKMNSKAVNGPKLRQSKKMLARMNVVAPLLMKGWTMREIRAEVMRVLKLESYSLQTVSRDVHRLMEEWQEERVETIDLLKATELRRLDARDRELWGQWEKSKEESVETVTTLRGGVEGGSGSVKQSERRVKQIEGMGDVAYLRELRENSVERCKLLGLYAPEKRELSGEINVVDALRRSGVVTEEDIAREVAGSDEC